MNNYSEEEYKIFSRLFILKEFSEENLKKLSNIKIGIIGMGGIGCPLSQYLVNSGIKELLIVDGDIVEKSNLNRQILFNFNLYFATSTFFFPISFKLNKICLLRLLFSTMSPSTINNSLIPEFTKY